MLGKAFLNYKEMMTVLTDIEAIINIRPLTYVGDDHTKWTNHYPSCWKRFGKSTRCTTKESRSFSLGAL